MGTHPIFESDFDCLTEKMADESVPVPETEPLNLHEDLKKLEDEINTLKQVLGSKEQQAAELRKKLGITPMQQPQSKLDAFGKSETVQKTSQKLNEVGDVTGKALSDFGQTIGSKFSEMKSSPSFQSFEQKVGGIFGRSSPTTSPPAATPTEPAKQDAPL